VATATKKAKWVVMVYIAADDKLANFAIESLKQMKDTAGKGVVVAAQLGVEGQVNTCRRYLFDHANKDASINDDQFKPPDTWRDPIHRRVTSVETLKEFVNEASRNCPADHYALILWGHGPELLHEAPTRAKRAYFSPPDLKRALESTELVKKGNLDGIGMDACSMSMIEYAHELKGVAKFLVASQEEVPDLSFPYDTLLSKFRKAKDPRTICTESVKYYVQAYQDCFTDTGTAMRRVSLSALELDKIDNKRESVTVLIKTLVDQLLLHRDQPEVNKAIFEARRKAQGFVGGLFVDIGDFCDHLQRLCAQLSVKNAGKIADAAGEVFKAIKDQNGCIIANQVAKDAWEDDASQEAHRPGCNGERYGLSIYFPYLKEKEIAEINASEVVPEKGIGTGEDSGKGIGTGEDSGKGIGTGEDSGKDSTIVNLAARNLIYVQRRDIIRDIEGYYFQKGFGFEEATGWGDFIRLRWSRILADKEPDQLGIRYSAQQCAANLLKALQESESGAKAAAAGKP
jgi:hypothetical protein